jgi:hypothetical protein
VGSQLVSLVQTLSPKAGAEQCRRKELDQLFWCHMYDVYYSMGPEKNIEYQFMENY